VRQLGTEELCQWLKTKLHYDKWKDAELVVRKMKIDGMNFLNCPEAKWENFGLEWGVANSLFQIAQGVSETDGAAVVGRTERGSGPVIFYNVPEIDMRSVDAIRDFLVSQMHDPNKFHCIPRVLGETSLSFALSGRDEAVKSAAEAFKVLSKPVGTTDRSQRQIPVCSGLSGLGKTRMLEEWKRIFDHAEIPETRLGALVLYYNGHMPQPIERLMTIEASFSWRLLHRLFIEGNGTTFAAFMKRHLPRKAVELDLRTTLEIIRSHLIRRGDITPSQCLHMFLGIDEYQSIEDVNGIQQSKHGGLLQDLLNSLGDILSDPVDGIRLYPMFAGTDFSVICIANSSKTETVRLPMTLLTASEMEEAVGALSMGSVLLGYSPVRRHLFYFGGVARWATKYIELLLKRMEESSTVPSVDFIESSFRKICETYVQTWNESILNYKILDHFDFIRLAAFSVSGCTVRMGNHFKHNVNWARLRDSSVCVIDDAGAVSVPYAMFHLVADWNLYDFRDEALKAFILSLRSLIDKVDSLVYDKAPWQLWEVFGAHFHALRINSLIILGSREVVLKGLFAGALVNGCDQCVRLKPMYVVQTEDKFNDNIGDSVGMKGHHDDKRNWRRGGWVVLNEESGEGVDIFYCLDKCNEDGQVVITDQRKRVSSAMGPSKVDSLVEKARIMHSVVCLFSCFTSSRFCHEDIPKDCCFVSYSQTRAYHGAMWLHPASSPCINLNSASISYLKMVFKGKDGDIFCKDILKERTKRKFLKMEDLEGFILAKKPNMDIKIKEEDLERVVFS